MDEEKVRQIIKEELANFIGSDRYTFQKNIQIFDARNIQVGKGIGTKIGTEGGSSGQKIGLWGTTPVTQPSAISDPSGQVNDFDSEARATAEAILDALQAIGIIQT